MAKASIKVAGLKVKVPLNLVPIEGPPGEPSIELLLKWSVLAKVKARTIHAPSRNLFVTSRKTPGK